MTPQKAIEILENEKPGCGGKVRYPEGELCEAFEMAIEALKQMEKDRWIPIAERMPEEHEWIGTKHFGTTISDEVYVTIEVPSGDRIVKHLCFQNGAIPSHEQRELDVFYKGGKPIAWRLLPEPYKEDNDDSTGSD